MNPRNLAGTILRGGTVYDGSGGEPEAGDVLVVGDRVAEVGPPGSLDGATPEGCAEIDVSGLAVCPGFINVLSHCQLTILQDPRSLGDLVQGVTTELIGEGHSMGPITPQGRAHLSRTLHEAGYDVDVTWTSIGEYLGTVERRGLSQNLASLVGAASVREAVVGNARRPATGEELDRMAGVVRDAMDEGAWGVGSALIYPPGSYASTEELVALCRAAGERRGRYFSHIRDEGPRLLEAVDELVRIAGEAEVPAEIWHFKATGTAHWALFEQAVARVEKARGDGLPVTADVYPYTASSTGLATIIPGEFWQEGPERLYERMADPAVRAEMASAIRERSGPEGVFADYRGASGVLVLGLLRDDLAPLQGRALAEVAAEREEDPLDSALWLIAEDRSRVTSAFFGQAEENLRRALGLPWVSICSDGGSMAPEPPFTRSPTHPRSYGAFARVLGHYVREEHVLSLAEAVCRMTSRPADALGLDARGRLAPGCHADIVVFDPDSVSDRATFADPHRLATGVRHVLVNGTFVLRDGEHTGEFPGRVLRGPAAR